MDKMKLGGGGRYEKLVSSLESKGVKDPKALAASIGMKKYGKAKFQSLAAKGRRRAERQSSYA
jgi:histidyl-tRNA synthetase